MDVFRAVVFQGACPHQEVVFQGVFRHQADVIRVVDFRHPIRAASAVAKDGQLLDVYRFQVVFQYRAVFLRRDDYRSPDEWKAVVPESGQAGFPLPAGFLWTDESPWKGDRL